jgi:ribosomal subunit interface protein
MDIPLQVTFRDLPHSPAIDEKIREKAARLHALSHRITSCRVTLERRHRHKRNGREYTVRIDLRVPERSIVVNQEHDEDVQIALREAFDAAERQLKEAA